MPTGYTIGIADGTTTTFADYAMGCARAFGALVSMRDEPLRVPIPDKLEPSTSYNQKRLNETMAELHELRLMSDADAVAQAVSDFDASMKSRADSEAGRIARLARYNQMLAEAEAWEPPSRDHVEMKAFMVQQLKDSMKFDCSPPNPAWDPEPVLQTGDEWRGDREQMLLRDVDYHTKQLAAEVERTGIRNEWLQQLRASLAA